MNRRRTRRMFSGSWRMSHFSMASVQVGLARLSEVRTMSSPAASRSSWASLMLRWSFHRIAGRMTRPSASVSTGICAPALMPMPASRPRLEARRSERRRHRLAEGAIPVLGILLGPARLRHPRGDRLGGFAEQPAAAVDHRRLEAAGAEIHAEQPVAVWRHAGFLQRARLGRAGSTDRCSARRRACSRTASPKAA